MSCTIVSIPIALFSLFGALTIDGAAIYNAINDASNLNYDDDINNELPEYKDILPITESNIIEKDFETAFMDKELLLKTITEHGIVDIQESESGEIIGSIDSFNFVFTKPSEDKPYNVKIMCREQDSAETKLNDISSEYTLNVQEASYLSIVENIKNTNMQIESETVEDDNTIVLTINVE